MRLPLFASLVSTCAVGQSLVVPPAYLAADGNSRFWIAGTIQPRRQQTIVGASMLTPMIGHAITGVSFRRNGENQPLIGGDAMLLVRLSHSAVSPMATSTTFDANHGPDVATVFQGTVSLPISPPPIGGVVPWDSSNIVHIAFQQPFAYAGGNLAIEVSGMPGSNPTSWWPADAVWQPNGGNATSVGNGSGPYGGPSGEWSLLASAELGPGATVQFTALGHPGDIAALGIASGAQLDRIDIGAFGVPGSFIHILDPFALELAIFGPPISSNPLSTGIATYSARVPTDPAFLGAQFGSQWFRIDGMGRIASSNAHQWSTANQYPGLGMTLITAPALGGTPTLGKVVPACGHVLRFDYQ